LLKLGYSPWPLFKRFNCDKILGAILLTTDTGSGIRRIGTELVRQSEEVGRKEGCKVASVLVTGKIFERAG